MVGGSKYTTRSPCLLFTNNCSSVPINRSQINVNIQMDEAAKRRQKREEELIRLEMIRVRKQMEAEKERASRER